MGEAMVLRGRVVSALKYKHFIPVLWVEKIELMGLEQ
jgi:hypothetical protein